MTVDVILPVLNEAGALPLLLEGFPEGFHPIVVDNASDDNSAAIAKELGAEVITEEQRGFGAACFTGLVAATSHVVAFMDADGSLDPHQLPRVVDPIRNGSVDLALGRRRAGRGAWPPHARVANRYLSWRISRAMGLRLTDMGPMRSARRSELLALGIEDRRFGWPLEMVMRAANAGWRIDEYDVDYADRIGKSKVTGTVRGTARAVRDMSRVWREVREASR